MHITNYSPEHKEAIKVLNYEWLEKYFAIEPIDVKVLSDPENEIIAKGGQIYYAWQDGKIVGTVSLMKKKDGQFELTKMAVTETVQGQGIGKLLIEHALEKAIDLEAVRVYLYSNTTLKPALALYAKYGFYEIPLESNEYKRSDIMMEKIL